MPQQSNIVSFEDARRSARRRNGAASVDIQGTSTLTRAIGADDDVPEQQPSQRLTTQLSRRQEAKRRRSKARASRKFDAAYGGGAAPAAAEGAPRAAVYEGKMGAKHRKAAAALQSGAASIQSFASGVAGSIRMPDFKHMPRKTLRTLFTVACVFVVCAMLYTPAQQYYQQMRERDRLVAEYEAVLDRNEALAASVENLQSHDGIEDKAHSEYGMVKEGEQAGSVAGIDVVGDSDFTANVIPGGVPAPDTWYSGFLDVFFLYAQ